MKGMFFGATAYNQPLNLNTAKVTTMESMFENAVNFAQDLTTFRYADTVRSDRRPSDVRPNPHTSLASLQLLQDDAGHQHGANVHGTFHM